MADDPRHDDDAPTAASASRQRQGGAPAAPEGRAPRGAAAAGRRSCRRWPAFFAARITSPTKRLRTLGALVAVADAAGPDMEVVVARRHGCTRLGKCAAMALGALKSLDLYGKSASRRGCADVPKNPTQPTTCARPKAALLSCRPLVGFLGSHLPTLQGPP